jgi:hypothetical protein
MLHDGTVLLPAADRSNVQTSRNYLAATAVGG